MRRCLFLALLFVSLLSAAPNPFAPPERVEYVLTVTSSQIGREVPFEGAYFFNGADPTVHMVRGSTPLDVRAEGDLGLGVFRVTSGDTNLVVELSRVRDGKVVQHFRASDRGVVFGENLTDKAEHFARTFVAPTP